MQGSCTAFFVAFHCTYSSSMLLSAFITFKDVMVSASVSRTFTYCIFLRADCSSALLIVSALLPVKDILLFSVFTQKYRKNSVGFLLHWHTHEDIRYSCLFLYVFFLQAFFTQKLQLVSMQWKNRLFSDHTVPFCVKNARFDSAETDR